MVGSIPCSFSLSDQVKIPSPIVTFEHVLITKHNRYNLFIHALIHTCTYIKHVNT